jgi:hypothetical protein
MRLFRSISLILAVIFAATGLLFLLIPDRVLILFNNLSPWLGMSQAPLVGSSFYLILAAGYMYIVTVLAVLMFRHPENHYFALLLTHAKLASSVLSIALFILQSHYLIYLVNFIVDGFIGIVVAFFYFKTREMTKWASI